MKNLTLRNLTEAAGGVYFGDRGCLDQEIRAVSTDSRKITDGCLFIAIRGNRSDGHSYIGQCLRGGAIAAVSEKRPEELDDYPQNAPLIVVKSSTQAIKDIAEFYRKQLSIPVIGIAGSVGKTSTKEMVASVLEQKYRVLKTEGNFNNELGLPLTIFRIRESDEIAVLEMGISDFGEMHRLAKIARPDTCIMTNIGYCHLENLKNRDGILKAKSEIFDFLKPDGHILVNGDDDKLAGIGRTHDVSPYHYGLNPENDVWADELVPNGISGISCRIHTPEGTFSVKIPMPGQHMVYNALAGTAAGLVYGLSLDEIRAGIESYRSISGRFHIIETPGLTIIDDCYNANPVSMKASLNVLQYASGRRTAILGDMGELGPDEVSMHREVGEYAARCGIDALYCVGKLSAAMASAAKAAGNAELEIRYFDNKQALLEKLPELVRDGDTVLVKASHFMEFGEIVENLEKL